MAQRRVAGIIYVRVNGDLLQAKGSFEVQMDALSREAMVGATGVDGYKEMPQAPYVSGKITVGPDLDITALRNATDATVTVELASGQIGVLHEGWFAGDGVINTEDGEMDVRFEGIRGEWITP